MKFMAPDDFNRDKSGKAETERSFGLGVPCSRVRVGGSVRRHAPEFSTQASRLGRHRSALRRGRHSADSDTPGGQISVAAAGLDPRYITRDPLGCAFHLPGRNGIAIDVGEVGVLDRPGLDACLRGCHGLACLRREASSIPDLGLRFDCGGTSRASRVLRINRRPSGHHSSIISRSRFGDVSGVHPPTARKRSVSAPGDGYDLLLASGHLRLHRVRNVQSGPRLDGRTAVSIFLPGSSISVVAIFAFNRAVASLDPKAAAAIIALVPVAVAVFANRGVRRIPVFIFVRCRHGHRR
jgi:hypothetical protein